MGNEANMIWPEEGTQFNASSRLEDWPAYLTTAERVRAEKIRQARMVFDGQHRTFFLDEGRSQFFYRRVKGNNGVIRPLYVTSNLLKLVSMKSADLLFGESPLISSDSPDQDAAIDAIAERSGLHQVCYQAALDASQEGDAYLEAVIYDGQVYLQQVPGDQIWPVGRVMPDGQYAAYVRRETAKATERRGDEATKGMLLETTYRGGEIERHLWAIKEGKKVQELPLDQWTESDLHGKENVERTGLDWNTITWIPNLLVRRKAVSDYDGGLLSLQDVVNAKNSQLAYVILRHASPKLIVPEQLLDEDGKLTDQEVYVARQGDGEAKYLTWEAQLDGAQRDRAFAVNQLLVQAETSPALLGMKEGAAPDAYRKVRLESFNSLSKAARKGVYWTEGLRTAVTVACMLEQQIPGRQYQLGTISVQLRDGIPVDETDEANRLATLKGAGIVDDRWCLEQLLGDQAEVDEVMSRMDEQRKAATPAILLGEAGESAH